MYQMCKLTKLQNCYSWKFGIFLIKSIIWINSLTILIFFDILVVIKFEFKILSKLLKSLTIKTILMASILIFYTNIKMNWTIDICYIYIKEFLIKAHDKPFFLGF